MASAPVGFGSQRRVASVDRELHRAGNHGFVGPARKYSAYVLGPPDDGRLIRFMAPPWMRTDDVPSSPPVAPALPRRQVVRQADVLWSGIIPALGQEFPF